MNETESDLRRARNVTVIKRKDGDNHRSMIIKGSRLALELIKCTEYPRLFKCECDPKNREFVKVTEEIHSALVKQ